MQIEFLQRENLTFEDRSIGITKEKLFPENDTFLDSIAKWKSGPQEATHPLTVKPTNDAIQPLRSTDYLEIALSWVKWWRTTISQEREKILKKMCDFHARLQEKRADINLEARNLRQLQNALESTLVCKPSEPTF